MRKHHLRAKAPSLRWSSFTTQKRPEQNNVIPESSLALIPSESVWMPTELPLTWWLRAGSTPRPMHIRPADVRGKAAKEERGLPTVPITTRGEGVETVTGRTMTPDVLLVES